MAEESRGKEKKNRRRKPIIRSGDGDTKVDMTSTAPQGPITDKKPRDHSEAVGGWL